MPTAFSKSGLNLVLLSEESSQNNPFRAYCCRIPSMGSPSQIFIPKHHNPLKTHIQSPTINWAGVVGSYHPCQKNAPMTIYNGFLLMLIAQENSPSPLTAFFSKFREKPQADFFSLLLTYPYGLGKETTTQRRNPMNKLAKQTLDKMMKKILFCLGITAMITATLWSAEKYDIGDNWDNQSIQSLGFSDAASTMRGDGGVLLPQELTALKELRRHFLKGYLEITPDSLESIKQYTMMYESSFDMYTGGVYVKRWKTSQDRESLQEFLFKFTQITKFKMEPVWDRDDEDFAETIMRSVQFFGDLGELAIAGCRLTDRHMEDILDSVPSPEKLKILDIRNNNLTPGVLPRIQERFTNLIDLKTELHEEAAKQRQAEAAEQEQQRRLIIEQQQQRESAAAAAERERIRKQEEESRKKEEERQRKLQQEAEVKQRQDKMAEERRQKEIADIKRERQLTVSRIRTPAVARGYEEIYERFMNGRLLYEGREVAQIATLINRDTLEGTFDLTGCGDAGQYLSINTGYRKGKKAENANKVEIWFVPKFLVERDLATTASHFQPIMGKWTAPIGIFWTWGGWDKLGWFDYLVTQGWEEISAQDLEKKWRTGSVQRQPRLQTKCIDSQHTDTSSAKNFMFIL